MLSLLWSQVGGSICSLKMLMPRPQNLSEGLAVLGLEPDFSCRVLTSFCH